jgi:xanthine/CO dehydrogenase XdhC/CoxF family maturation factor
VPGRVDPLAFAAECLRTQRRGAVVTVIRSRVPEVKVGARVALSLGGDHEEDAIGDDILRTAMLADARAAIGTGESCNRSYTSARGSVDVFVEAILPPPRLFVFGTGHDALPLVELAHDLGWDVIVCTHEPRELTRQRFGHAADVAIGSLREHSAHIDECDRAVAVVMSHNYDVDREQLGMLIASRARYIGVLGPRERTTRMLNELYLVAQDDPRLHAPLGLPLGADTPHELALAIVAEIQAALHQVPLLRDRIYDRKLPRITEAVELATVL